MEDQLTVVPMTQEAAAVAERVKALKNSIMENSIELGRLLKTVRDNGYHRAYGFGNFGDWVEQDSGADMSKRQAAYLILVVERAEQLQIPDAQLMRLKLSSAKEIFSLPADTPDDQIRTLLTHAETAPLSTVRSEVQKLRTGGNFTYRNLKMEQAAAEQIWEPAIERVRATHGGYRDDNGQPVDISETAAALYLAAEYLAQPEEHPADPDVLEGEFEDVIEA